MADDGPSAPFMRSRSTFVALCLLFVCSGACGLTYQVLWLRLLSLVFGVTVHAASTVLAAFMAGLALGSLLAERLARRGHPLKVFAALEAGIAVAALATPAMLGAADGLYRPLSAAAGDSLWVLTAGRFVASFAVLLVPTVLMGATLPVLSRADLVRASGARLGTLYAVNTTGALAGALVTGYVLIGGIGIQRTFFLAATVNLLVAGAAWWLSRFEPLAVVAGSGTESEKSVPGDAIPAQLVLSAMAISGVASLALEIVWFRILVQFLPATSYAFTTMLATVLAGIAVGSALASRALTRPRNWSVVLAGTMGATSIVVLTSLAILGATYSAGWRTSGLIQGSAAAILPAAILMGYAFPIALALWTRPGDLVSRPRAVGTVYAANVVGGIAGAVLGGFVLLPWLGSRRALIACAAAYLAASVVMLARLRRRLAALALVVLFVVSAGAVPDPFDAALTRRHGRGERIFWKEEGVQTSVSIHTHAFRGWLMYLDGLHQASDAPEMVRLHRLIGHLPMVLHPKPERALVVGLGGGATPGAVSQHDAEVLVVELSDTVRKGAEFFKHVNYDLFTRPNVRVRVDDGRNFLSLTDARFDVVTADLIQPIHAGAGNLYSREYFQLVHDSLTDDGLVLQWIGHRPDSQYKLIMRTFLDVFPYATLWADGQLLVGAKRPLRLARAPFEAKRANAMTRAALDEIGLDSFETLTSWFVAGPDELRRFVGPGPLLTDDRPLVEYHRSLPSDERIVDLSSVRSDVAGILVR
jgi:spermidine synthase